MSSVIYLSDQQGLLSRFTQGLAGRYLHLKSTDVLTGTFRPEGATTDGQAIYLPESVDQFDLARHNLGVYRVSILHQLGYFEFGTFDFSFGEAVRRLSDLPEPPANPRWRRHDDRPVDLEKFFDRFLYPLLAQRLFLLLEDFRIDSRLHVPFPGIRADLDRVTAHALSNRQVDRSKLTPVSRLLDSMLEFSLGRDSEFLIQRDQSSRLAELIRHMSELSSLTSDVYDTAAATLACYRTIVDFATVETHQQQRESAKPTDMPAGEDPSPPGDSVSLLSDDDMEIQGADFRGDVMPELVQRRMRLSDLIAEMEAIEEAGEYLPPQELAEHLQDLRSDFERGELENADDRRSDDQVEGNAAQNATTRPENADALARLIRKELDENRFRIQREESVLRRVFGESGISSRSYFYDEWDYAEQIYRKGWCRLYEQRLEGDDYDYFRRVRARYRMLAASIENQLRRIRAESLTRVKRVADGDELDLDQLLTSVIDRQAGLMPDDRVYSRKERAKREVAAAFLLDMSASTDDEVPDPESEPVDLQADANTNILTHDWGKRPSDRRVIDVEKDALVLISEALAVLGDAYAVYGFSGYGREEVEFYVAKEFDEALNSRTKSALAAMKPRRSTRMGPAIRHTIRKLQLQDAPLKVMIILSDGFPQDCDYGPDRNDHEYGIQDTAKAIKEAEDKNIATFCITVDQSGYDYLRKMCAEDRYLVIDEIESLPNELTKIYQRLTV